MSTSSAAHPALDRPIFIVSSPRSGSSLLFLTLARAPGVFTIGGESHALIETLADLHPSRRRWSSNRLRAKDATPALAEALAQRLYAALRDRDGRPPRDRIRAIEKTPKNSLRVPFFDAIFPDALFVYLYREPRETLASMIEAWRSGRFVTYPRLPGWTGLPWSLLLIPGWRDLVGRTLSEIVACQWTTTTHILLADLAALPQDRVRAIGYSDFIADPGGVLARLAAETDLDWDVLLSGKLPLSPTVVSDPRPDKWRDRESEIDAVLPLIVDTDAMARAALARYAC